MKAPRSQRLKALFGVGDISLLLRHHSRPRSSRCFKLALKFSDAADADEPAYGVESSRRGVAIDELPNEVLLQVDGTCVITSCKSSNGVWLDEPASQGPARVSPLQ